ncbi:MAG: 16S rRNA (cytosine(1402)-N(4))-methyltransferase RsmH, partial [Candidatus Competibacterales bacterium]|nr:16S rRNA (cytosine(1402)-N(4))-methyltransferase RsmH [Candidatus Competibacterales bacterium]
GHSDAILERLGESGILLALDRDPDAESSARKRFGDDRRFRFTRSTFGRLGEVVRSAGLGGRIDGVLLDLGVSSPQLDDPTRGFSFRNDGPLDMRMDPSAGISAAEWLATVTESELARTLRDYGEERFHRRIARAVVAARRETPLTRTRQLAELIARAVPTREPSQHPATRSFQAIRIALNRELEELGAALVQAVEVLTGGGRLVVISFHSLEDRLVKRFLRRESHGPELPPGLPVTAAASGARLRLPARAQRPGPADRAANPRARSAVLRVAERLP